jgi:tetraacyldisaccharide 4'-kinase
LSRETDRAAAPSGSPWQWLYGAAHGLRRRWYRSRASRLPRPVVSIGNLHWGGTGKTPLTAAVARHLVAAGRRVAILSRGYGRRDHRVRVVSTGQGPLLGPSVAGDEPVLLAGEAPGAAVVVAPRRHDAGRHALERLDPPPDLFLLDDGFSHLSLRRDVDLLVFPRLDRLGGGRLWPGGRLREPLTAARHAHALLAEGGRDEAEDLARALERHGFRGPVFAFDRRTETPRRVEGGPLPPGANVLLVSGVARPAAFEEAAATFELTIVGAVAFADHHDYPAASRREIARAFADSGAEWVLTTSKDRVKLLGRLDLPLAEIPLRVTVEETFWPWLDERLVAGSMA